MWRYRCHVTTRSSNQSIVYGDSAETVVIECIIMMSLAVRCLNIRDKRMNERWKKGFKIIAFQILVPDPMENK